MSLMMVPLLSSSVFAFDDLKGHSAEAKIESLSKQGIVSGIDKQHFNPKGTLTYAQGVQMIVKGLKLNIDTIKFIKQPQASDYFTKVKDKDWFAESFIIAQINGLQIPKDVNPNSTLTKEVFSDLLYHALFSKADFAVIEIWAVIKDEDKVTKEYMNSIQKLLITKIATLDKNSLFPKGEITRAEASEMLYNAMEFLKKHEPSTPSSDEAAMSIEKITDQVNKVTLSIGEKPNNGYGITILGVDFGADNKAVIRYSLQTPEPDQMYLQVITSPKAVTYVSSQYKVVLQQVKDHAPFSKDLPINIHPKRPDIEIK